MHHHQFAPVIVGSYSQLILADNGSPTSLLQQILSPKLDDRFDLAQCVYKRIALTCNAYSSNLTGDLEVAVSILLTTSRVHQNNC